MLAMAKGVERHPCSSLPSLFKVAGQAQSDSPENSRQSTIDRNTNPDACTDSRNIENVSAAGAASNASKAAVLLRRRHMPIIFQSIEYPLMYS